jgi:hypothetical protein
MSTSKNRLKQFDTDKLKPTKGWFNAMIFENKSAKIPKTLFYDIQIELKKVVIDGESVKPNIQLDFMILDIKRLKDLENSVHEFANPEDIDGSIYLFYAHNFMDISKMEFGAIVDNTITVTIYYSIDFKSEGTGYSNTKGEKLKVKLTFNRLIFPTSVLEPKRENAGKAKELLSKFCDPRDYGSPKISKEGFFNTGSSYIARMKVK